MERFAKIAALAMNQVLDAPIEAHDLETPPDPKLGDFGFPCFKLAKQFRKSPPQVAQQLVADLLAKKAVPETLTVQAVGPYVNFTVDPREVLDKLLADILKTDAHAKTTYGSLPQTREKAGFSNSAPPTSRSP